MVAYNRLKIGPPFPNAWNICDVVNEVGQSTIYIAVRGEMENAAAHDLFKKLVEVEGRKVIGLCSYQNFPQRTCNPHQNACYPKKTADRFIYRYGHHVILWCHCFRQPEHYIHEAASLPLLLFSESDQYTQTPQLYNMVAAGGEKQYDFFASVPEGDWNGWIRNIQIYKKWLNFMADDLGLRILVCGSQRRADFSMKIDVIDFQPWHLFIKALNQCDYLFCATGHDASPRLIIEALALDKPVLVNENILGGWKYINKYTGSFFCETEPIKDKITQFISDFQSSSASSSATSDAPLSGFSGQTKTTSRPRQWLRSHFSVDRSTAVLAKTLAILGSFQWTEVVDAILYINLENRPDRRTAIEAEFKRMEVPSALVHRIVAVEDERCGHLGCTKSHLKAWQYAHDHGYERVLVLEDDFQFALTKERTLFMVHEFLRQRQDRWDVLMLATGWFCYNDDDDDLAAQEHEQEQEQLEQAWDDSFVKRLKYGTTCAGYLVKGLAYQKTLVANFQESCALLSAQVAALHGPGGPGGRLKETHLALDQYWIPLQERDRFYTTEPPLGRQSGSRSSILQ